MAQLPADRTKLNVAIANQQPSIVASAQANREALIEAYDTIDKLYDFTSGLVAGNILQPYPFGLYRNAIINGNFDVWQRGTSFYNPISTKFLCDRFFVQHSIEGFPNITISRQGITPGDVLGSRYCMRIETDGPGSNLGNNNFYTIRQKIENGTRLLCGDGRKVTFSFWARSSIPGKKMAVNLKQNYGTGGSPTTEEELVGKVFDLTSTWTKFSVTFTTNTLASKTFGTNQDDTLILVLWIQWGADFVSRFGGSAAESFGGAGYIDIAQVQLNAGDVALPFQPRSFAEELALCQRYYEKSYNIDTPPGTATDIGCIQGITEDGTNNGAHYDTVYFKVRKRAVPTVIVYGTGGTSNTVNDETADRSVGAGWFAMPSETGFRMNYTLQNATSGRRRFHYVADAEL